MGGLTGIGIVVALAIGGWFVWAWSRPPIDVGKTYLKAILQKAGLDIKELPEEFFDECVSYTDKYITRNGVSGKSRMYQQAELTRLLDNVPPYICQWMDRMRLGLPSRAEGIYNFYDGMLCHYKQQVYTAIASSLSKKATPDDKDALTAKQLATTVNNILKGPFAFTKHMNDHYEFLPPANFWKDDYVVGFSTMLLHITLEAEFGGATMLPEQKGMILYTAGAGIFGGEFEAVLMQSGRILRQEEQASPEYERGSKDASIFWALINSPKIPNEIAQEPLVIDAQERVSSDCLSGMPGSVAPVIGGSYVTITFGKHIREKFLSGEGAG